MFSINATCVMFRAAHSRYHFRRGSCLLSRKSYISSNADEFGKIGAEPGSETEKNKTCFQV